MKVPSAVIGRVRTSDTDQKYLEAKAPDTGSAIARGFAQIGQAIGGVAADYQQDIDRETRKKQAEADRIEQTARAFELDNKFQTAKGGYSTGYNDAQMKAPANGGGFMKEQLSALYKTEADFFAQNPDMDEAQKGEYKLKFNVLREEYGNRSLDFQQKANDAYIKESIDVDFQQKKVALADSPDQMEAYRQELFEKVDKSNLDPFTKMTHKRAIDRGLQLVTMKKTLTDAKVRNATLRNVGTMNAEVTSIVDGVAAKYGIPKDAARQFAWIESSGDPSAVSKTNAKGLFQFTKGTWERFGKGDPMDPVANAEAFGRLWQHNRNELTKVLGHEPTPGQLYLAHQQGEGGAKALLSHPEENVVDALMKGGAYRNREKAMEAVMVNGGSLRMTAGQFANKWISKFDGASPDYAQQVLSDPKFSAVTYEDRASLDADSTTAANHLVAQQTTARKAENDAYLNATLNKAMDGKYSRLDLDEDRAAGRFSDFSERKQIEDLIRKREEDGLEKQAAAAFWTNGRTSGGSEEENKLMNKGYTMGGASERVYSKDPRIIDEAIVPMVQSKGDMPTQLVGDLTGMTRSMDQSTAIYALEALAKLRGSAPAAYAKRVNDEENKRVSQYLDLKGGLPADELMRRINPNGDPQVLKAQDELRKQALDYLDNKSDSTRQGGTILDDTVKKIMNDMYDPGVFGDEGRLPDYAPQAQAMRAELRTLIAEENGVYGNIEQATTAAANRLKQFWTVSNVTGEPIVMRNAPDNPRTGYRPLSTNGVDPDYSWIVKNITRETNLQEGQTFQIVSDDTTKAEVEAYNAHRDPGTKTPRPPPPSYKIIIREPDGITLRDAFPGKRMHFEATAEDKATDGQAFVHAQALDRLSEARVKLANAEQMKEMGGHDIPQEFVKEAEAAQAEADATNPFSEPYRQKNAQPLRARPRSGRAGGWLLGTKPVEGPPIPEATPPAEPLPRSMEEE